MKTGKQFLAVVLAAVLLLCSVPMAFGAEIVDSGYCGGEGDGTNLTWTLDSDGLLTISGTGKMEDYDFSSSPFRGLNVKSVVIDDGVENIGGYAFNNCLDLTSVAIRNSVTSIGEYAFIFCNSLISLTSGAGLTSIGRYAFYDTGFASISIPDSVTSIGEYAFSDCRNLTSVTIPDSVTSIGAVAFAGFNVMTAFSVDSNNAYFSSDEYGCLYNKNKTSLIQYPCNSILTEFTIPDSVTSIENNAFKDSVHLTSIMIPNSVLSIGNDAFSRCFGLTSVAIPSSVTSIDSAFDDCYSVTAFSVDSNNANYCSDEYGCLYNKDKTEFIQYPIGNVRTEFTIPDGVTSIGDSAFSHGSSLTSITIPDSVTSIGAYAFDLCYSLTTIKISNHITSIGEQAFWCCTSLTSITIPDTVTSIGDAAFTYCEKLTSITIPDGVTSIGGSTFGFCKGLTSIVILGDITSIGSFAFHDCTALNSIMIPDSVTEIGYGAFEGCEDLKAVYYAGTQAQWNTISVGESNDLLLEADIHFEHVHPNTYTETLVSPATCVAKGLKTFTCDCGVSFSEEIAIDPTNHVNTENKEAVASTCTEKGYTAGVWCNDCKTWISGHEEQPLAAHQTVLQNAKPATCSESGYTGDQYCMACKQIITPGTSIKAFGHSWGDWAVTPATCTEAGVKERTCSACGAVETKTIKKISHLDADHDGKCDLCGNEVDACPLCGKTEHDSRRTEILHKVFVFLKGFVQNVVLPLHQMIKNR